MVKGLAWIVGVLGILLGMSGCKTQPVPLSIVLEGVEKTKQIKLTESRDYPIGRIFDAAMSRDSVLHLLDIASADVKLFSFEGRFIKKIGGRGEGRNELRLPRTLEVIGRDMLVGDMGSSSTKWFNREGDLVREIVIGGFRIVIGNTKMVDQDKILHAALWDGSPDLTTPLYLVDINGTILKNLGKFPVEYRSYELTANTQIDFDASNGNYVIAYHQSPALFIGNLSKDNGKLFALEEERPRYISSNRPLDPRASGTDINDLVLEEALGDRVLFLADSVIVRSYLRCTAESLKRGSMVMHRHFLQAYSRGGEQLGEVPLPGRLHGRFRDWLLVEESDEPGNHTFGLYSVHFKKAHAFKR